MNSSVRYHQNAVATDSSKCKEGCEYCFSILFWNSQSLRNKIPSIESYLNDKNYDCLCITEHWLKHEESSIINLDNYIVKTHFSRLHHQHGGVMSLLNPNILCNSLENVSSFSVEKICELCAVFIPIVDVIVITMYRSPNGDFNKFIDTVVNTLNELHGTSKYIILGGDINLLFGTQHAKVLYFCNLMCSYGLHPLVNFKTRKNNTLDNVFTNLSSEKICVGPANVSLSDHVGISVKCTVRKPIYNNSIVPKYVRPITQKGKIQFYKLLDQVDWRFINLKKNPCEIFSMFLDKVLIHFNISFPVRKLFCKKSKVHNIIWFTPELKKMRETLCLIHDAYKLHGTLQLKALYSDYKYRYAQSIKKAKINANNNFIRDHQNNSKAMWSLINRNKQRTIQETTRFIT